MDHDSLPMCACGKRHGEPFSTNGSQREALEHFECATARGVPVPKDSASIVARMARENLLDTLRRMMARPRPAPLELAEVRAKSLGAIIADQVPEGWLFLLILASSGDGGSFTHLSNMSRDSAIPLLREFADKIESGEPEL